MKKFMIIFLLITSTAAASFGCSARNNKLSNTENNASAPVTASVLEAPEQKPTVEKDIKQDIKTMDLNDYVLKVVSTYEIGKYPYLLNNDYENYNGVTQTLAYQGTTIAKANPDGSRSSHCVGLTFEVFYRAMQERNKELGLPEDNFNNMTAEQLHNFLLTWYAAQPITKAQGNQLAGAIVKYGLGTQIKNLEDVKSGDFVDFSRTNYTGHTAVFMNWIRNASGRIIGFRYWSTQTSTKGINYRVEYFSDNKSETEKGLVDRSQLYIGRVGSVNNYKAFK